MFEEVRKLSERFGLDELVWPSSRDASMSELVSAANIAEGEKILDVECSASRLLPRLRPVLPRLGARYTGVDRDKSGIEGARTWAHDIGANAYVDLVKADSLSVISVPSRSHDLAFVHFTLSTLAGPDERFALLREVHRILKDHGRLLIAEPTTSYDADRILENSKHRDETVSHLDPMQSLFNRTVGYRIVRRIEKNWERRIRSGQFHGYGEHGLRDELAAAGFVPDWVRWSEGGMVCLSMAHVAARH